MNNVNAKDLLLELPVPILLKQNYHPFSCAGASLVQLYTALAYAGPEVVPSIKAELARLLERDGITSVAAAVGADHLAGQRYSQAQNNHRRSWWWR